VSFEVRTTAPFASHALAQALDGAPGVLGIKVQRI
jgi:hypothetical protein